MDTTPGELTRKSPVSVDINTTLKDLKRERTVENLHRERSNSLNSGLWNGVNGNSTISPASTYPQWMRREAQNEISRYLSKFGGMSMFDTKTGLPEGAGFRDAGSPGGAGLCYAGSLGGAGFRDAGMLRGAGLRDAGSAGGAGLRNAGSLGGAGFRDAGSPGGAELGGEVTVDQADDNDGDDEEESLDSIQTQ